MLLLYTDSDYNCILFVDIVEVYKLTSDISRPRCDIYPIIAYY